MDIEALKNSCNAKPNLASSLGIEFISTPEADVCKASIVATPELSQPAGFLNGGTLIAMAESLAGMGSMALRPDASPVGISVTANHMRPVLMGQQITGTAKIIQQGRTVHVWNIDFTNATGHLVSSARVTNFISVRNA